jgi:hypothetical protein
MLVQTKDAAEEIQALSLLCLGPQRREDHEALQGEQRAYSVSLGHHCERILGLVHWRM